MGKFIELSITYVDRDSDPAMSHSMGMLQWNAEKLGEAPKEQNPLDEKTMALLRAYIAQHDAEIAELDSILKAVKGAKNK